MKVYIIFRCCTRDESQVHGNTRLIGPKSEITLRCFKSLVDTVLTYTHKIHFVVIDDHSYEKDVLYMKNTLERYFPHNSTFIHLKSTGNSASLHLCYDFVNEFVGGDDDIIYFVEDDYLHYESSFDEMYQSYHQFKDNLGGREVAIFPHDCNDRYKPEWLRPSYIVAGSCRYWRTTDCTTGTFMVSNSIFRKFYNLFDKFADYGVDPEVHEENTLNLIWRHPEGPILFSPIPTLTYHLQLEEHLPHYTNYRELWDSIVL